MTTTARIAPVMATDVFQLFISASSLASTVYATNRLQDRLNKDKEAAQRSGESTRTDPAQQHIPRLEELEREQRERDRDDRVR
jgi:hypothetical protein